MRPDKLGLMVVGLIATISGGSDAVASDLAVAITPADGTGMLIKRFHVDGPTTVSGVRFGSNDARTIFPEVSLLSIADSEMQSAVVLARVLNASQGDAERVQVSWEPPVRLEAPGDYYVAIRMPAGDVKRGPKDGARVKASAEGTGDSFGARGSEGKLASIGVDLDLTVIATGLSGGSTPNRAAESPDDGSEAVQTAFLKAHSQGRAAVLRISFGVSHPTQGSLSIFDVAGRRVRTLASGDLAAGIHWIDWDGRNDRGLTAASGVYVARLVLDVTTLTRKLILAK